jgi:hypothetical protein
MEADWEIEIGGDSPVIEPDWPGLVDLRIAPAHVHQLPELHLLPALREFLVRLNAPSSPVWTSKCDVWAVAKVDPDELDAPADASRYAVACYIDLLSRDPGSWTTLENATDWCNGLCTSLHAVRLPCCRLDLVVRQAVTKVGPKSIGITAYLTACGASCIDAESRLGTALEVFGAGVAPAVSPVCSGSSLQ